MKPTFAKLCALVTTDLFQFAAVKNELSRDHCQQLKDAVEIVLEDHYLEAVFQNLGKLNSQVWLEKTISDDANFIFDATKLRAMIFEQAGVPQNHIKAKLFRAAKTHGIKKVSDENMLFK